MDERIIQIKNLAMELFKVGHGAGGQSVDIQVKNRLKSELGKTILKAINQYEKEYNEMYS